MRNARASSALLPRSHSRLRTLPPACTSHSRILRRKRHIMLNTNLHDGLYLMKSNSVIFSLSFSECSSQGFSWPPSNRYLNRSKLASTRLCNNHIIIYLGARGRIRSLARGQAPHWCSECPGSQHRCAQRLSRRLGCPVAPRVQAQGRHIYPHGQKTDEICMQGLIHH